ncbi:hypothetical protein CANINC_000707 [Pichia inconspicua]|uniref:CRAL-TRIO domain-containing protein n=1 Tax=Pichia inconspicua TaxID=52247 RepID=A0A4T0X5P1_9ASCO|nr:hypothetical protein CANINC_000707 [[Candida] inconspicua]
MANRCYYRSATLDPQSQLPLYVLDLTHVPPAVLSSSASQPNDTALQSFTDTLISLAPDQNHALVVFTNGLHREGLDDSTAGTTDRSLTLIRFLKLIPAASRENLQKMYIVHGTWILKSVVDVFSKFHALASNTGRQPSIIKCDTLTALSHHIDLTKLPISLHTYIIDKIYFHNSRIILTRDFPPLYGEPLTIYDSQFPLSQFQRIFNNLISYLSRPQLDVHLSRRDWNTIIKCSSLPAETKLAIDILSDCLKRGQLVSLSDYSFVEHYMIFVKFVLKLSNSKTPLIPPQLLLAYKIDFSDITQVNSFLNKVLLFKHHLSSTTYDNAYILIKIFKIFNYLTLKVQREVSLIDPSAKNSQKAIERHKLRLVLAFTKILYAENSTLNSTDSLASTDLDDDAGFDNLFKFVRSLFDNYDTLTVLGTPHTIDDFNNHISTDDFIAFENFKINALGDTDKVEARVVNNLPQSHTSPVKITVVPSPPRTNSHSPSPSMPRNNELFTMAKHKNIDIQPMTPDSSETAPIPVTQSQVDIVIDSLESLGIEDDVDANTDDVDIDQAFTTPTRPPRIPQKKPSTLSLHETIVPMVNNNLRKYTDRDLALQEEVERQRIAEQKKQEHAREVERGVRRGERKVSRLARLYEEKYMQ